VRKFEGPGEDDFCHSLDTRKHMRTCVGASAYPCPPANRLIGNAGRGRGGCPQNDCPQSKYFRRDNISLRRSIRIFLRTLLFTVFTFYMSIDLIIDELLFI